MKAFLPLPPGPCSRVRPPAAPTAAAAALLCLALGTPAAWAQGTQKINPGLWEHGFSMKSESGRMEKAMKEAQAAMASMPPEQRKMMEQMMAQQGVAFGAMGNTVRVCVTKEEAERDEPPQAQEGCTQQHKRSGNVWQVSFRCPGPPPSSGEGQVTLVSPAAYTGSFKLLTDVDGKPERMTMSMSGKWLGADCGNIKPAGRR